MPFGLVSSTTLTGNRSLDSRRKIFRSFPTGAAPLLGLLSMLPNEETDKAEYGWFEQRFPTQLTATVATGTAPFANEDGTSLADQSTLTENVEYRLNVLDTSQFKPSHVIEIRKVTWNNQAVTVAYYDITGIVTRVVSSTVLIFRPTASYVTVDNPTTKNNGKSVAIKGTANRENGRSGPGIITFPINPKNYTQIFKSYFNISRTALKAGLTYDSRGPWKTQAWDNGLRHMIEMEKAFFFGEKQEALVADPETGEVTPEKKTGGIIWFLKQWEAAGSIYRGPTSAAVTLNSDINKRIIDLGGVITQSDLDTYIDRAFKVTNDKGYEKLCFCGGTFLRNVSKLVERNVVRQVNLTESSKTLEFWVTAIDTLRGTVYFKVHPLFDYDPDLADAGLFLDMGNLRYRPLNDSDTVFLKGQQETDRDGRKDGWLTEAGLECQFPESHLLIKSATVTG